MAQRIAATPAIVLLLITRPAQPCPPAHFWQTHVQEPDAGEGPAFTWARGTHGPYVFGFRLAATVRVGRHTHDRRQLAVTDSAGDAGCTQRRRVRHGADSRSLRPCVRRHDASTQNYTAPMNQQSSNTSKTNETHTFPTSHNTWDIARQTRLPSRSL